MLTLALDVDGVLLDPERGGDGHWTNELHRRLGIARADLRRTFFMCVWDDVVNGRRAIEPALAESLEAIGSSAEVEDVLTCWFEADFVPIDTTIDLARRAARSGIRVALVTNQEHRRAAYLVGRLGDMFPIDTIIYSADLGVQKHEPEFFTQASVLLGVTSSPDRVVFVDDARHNVDQAIAAGWRARHATREHSWITDVESLLDLEPPASRTP